MRTWLLVILGLVSLLAIMVLAYVAWANRQRIRRQDRQLDDLSQELTATREKLADFTKAMLTIDQQSVALPEQPTGENGKRKRHLRIVPPLVVVAGGLTAALKRAEHHPGPVVAGASLAASAGILSMIAIGAGPDGREDQSALRGQPPASIPAPPSGFAGTGPPLPPTTTSGLLPADDTSSAYTGALRAAQPSSSAPVPTASGDPSGTGRQRSITENPSSPANGSPTSAPPATGTTTITRPAEPTGTTGTVPCLVIVLDPILGIRVCVGGSP